MASVRNEVEDRSASAAAAAMRIGFRTVDGVRIRVAESDGPAARTILLTSPWPESIHAFAPIWASLAGRFRLFAVDLPGYGASEGRSDLFSPQAMGAFLLRLIEECELGRPHVVGPDVGTAATLFAAASSPDSMASAMVGSGGAAVPIELGEPLRGWALDPDLDRLKSMDSASIVNAALDTVAGHEFAPEIREDYLASYAGHRFVDSMAYVRRYPDELPVLAQRLADITTPVLVFAGLHDRVVPLVNAEWVAARVPYGRLATVDAGHFVWEEAPDAFAAMVADWAGAGHRQAARDGRTRPDAPPQPGGGPASHTSDRTGARGAPSGESPGNPTHGGHHEQYAAEDR
jgi:pimeloyl-ACP methyl ester carboxylesterase